MSHQYNAGGSFVCLLILHSRRSTHHLNGKASLETDMGVLDARIRNAYEPIQQMVQLLESKGVRVYWLNVDSPSLDAICFWKEGQPFVMLNAYKDA